MSADTASPPGRLTDARVRSLVPPERGNRITYDKGKEAIRGFGVRATAAGAKAFVLNYSIAGRERRYTIGSYPAFQVAKAREEARRVRQLIELGQDPLGAREATREAATVNELCDRYLAEHASRKRTRYADEGSIRRVVRPELGNHKVAAITFSDVDRLHRKVTEERGPYAGNRLVALLSTMFKLAIRWEMRPDNPVTGVERNTEQRRYRYLAGDELRRLSEALAALPNQQAANAIRLLLLTGARRGEVLLATWDQFDLETGLWIKPASHTKQQREHRTPLSAPARQLLAEMRKTATGPHLFPGRHGQVPIDLKLSWDTVRRVAQFDNLRLHDLRHTFASVLVSSGLSLPVIGALLGHSLPSTTARYAHLFDDPLRAATERAGAFITGNTDDKPLAEVVPIRGTR